MEADWARWKYVVLFRTQVLFKNFNTFETKLLAALSPVVSIVKNCSDSFS